MELFLMFVVVLTATFSILNINLLTAHLSFSISSLAYINMQVRYQGFLLLIAVFVLIAAYWIDPDNFTRFMAVGDVFAPTEGVSWLLIPDGTSWMTLGGVLLIVITLPTTLFIYLQFRGKGSLKQLLPFIPWVILFSLSNSFAEEIVYRIGVIVPLAENIEASYILLISAVLFGAPHLRGMPNGIIGVLMAGFLGWLLAKSVMETGGIFWAWTIHFLQDVVIFSAFVIASLGNELKKEIPASA